MVICFLNLVAVFLVPLGFGVVKVLMTSRGDLADELELVNLVPKAVPFALMLYPFVSAGVYGVTVAQGNYWKGLQVWLAQFAIIAVGMVVVGGIAYGVKSIH
jgi:hypothetical protein